MNYLPIAITAYVLNGCSLLIDKFLVSNELKSPFVYTFYISLLGLLILLAIPFGFTIPDSKTIIYASLSGLLMVLALLSFFKALTTLNVTVVAPVVGTFNPLFALIFGTLFTDQLLAGKELTAFGLLTAGSAILTFNLWWGKSHFDKRLIMMVISGLMFGLSYTLLREAFLASSLLDGLVISRIAMALTVLVFLLIPQVRKELLASKISNNNFLNQTGFLMLSSQFAGASSGLLLAYGISKAPPSLINSFHGIQYIILLGAAYLLSKKHPEILDEKINSKTIFPKLVGLILMGLGLYLLGIA